MSAGRHLSIETMARWLGGELDPETVQEIVLPHLLAVCPTCRTTHDQLARNKARVYIRAAVERRDPGELFP